jgi:hypothetical protein
MKASGPFSRFEPEKKTWTGQLFFFRWRWRSSSGTYGLGGDAATRRVWDTRGEDTHTVPHTRAHGTLPLPLSFPTDGPGLAPRATEHYERSCRNARLGILMSVWRPLVNAPTPPRPLGEPSRPAKAEVALR